MKSRLFRQCYLAGILSVCSSLAFAGERTAEAMAVVPTEGNSFTDSVTLSGYFFGKENLVDSAYDRTQQWKKDNHLPITFGANHWFHVDRDEKIYGDGYGVPGSRGTYYYYLGFDPTVKLPEGGFVTDLGLHVQGRIRDDESKLRGFYEETYWLYEGSAFAKTTLGTFSVGKILQHFGYTWNNSWWEGVPYFDGYRFNPAWGVSWDHTWNFSEDLAVGTSAQYFLTDDRVSGAIAGADAESSLAGERNTFILRATPVWKLDDDLKITFGASFLTREIEDPDRFGPGLLDERQTAWSTDLAIDYKKLTLFAQYTDSRGTISPARHVSGGPSDRQNSFEVGLNYKLGPIAPHVNFSKGWDHNPDGEQYIFNPGITFQISKSLTLYTEYVKWDVTNSAGATAKFDDGFEIILVWNF
ncbi:MAG TPA: hypothetical protein VF585_01915 [Chthoniobacterales bacterium]|jgi:predicted porin